MGKHKDQGNKKYHPRPNRREQSDRVMNCIIPLRMAAVDLEIIRAAAAAANLPVSTFIRQAALSTARSLIKNSVSA